MTKDNKKKKKKSGNIWLKIFVWLMLIAMVGSLFSYMFAALFAK